MSERSQDGRVKRPAFQFYPGDWQRDTALRSCSIAARGLWMDMLCLMHDGEPYGHLRVGTKVIGGDALARMVGESPAKVKAWLAELGGAGVYSTLDDGTIYSRRMVRDEHIRQVRGAAGKLGGNPTLARDDRRAWADPTAEDKQKTQPGGVLDKQPPKQTPTPASAPTASSTSAGDDDQVLVAARAIVASLNRGLAEHADPRRRQNEHLRPASPGSQAATRTMLAAGVPVDFALATVGALARTHVAEGKIRSLGYFTDAVIREWELDCARRDAAAAPQPLERPLRVHTGPGAGASPFRRRPTLGEQLAIENELRRRRGEAPPEVLFDDADVDTTPVRERHGVTADAQS